VEQNRLKLHRAYYHQAVKKKALTTAAVVLMPEEVEEAMHPYLLQIYQEDFNLTSLTKSGFKVTTKEKYPMMIANKTLASDDSSIEHDDQESDDDAEEREEEERQEEEEDEYGNNDIGLDLAEH
jgi:hypothetical protein